MGTLLSNSNFSPTAPDDEELVEGNEDCILLDFNRYFLLDMLVFQDIFESVSLICCVEKRCKRRSLQMSDVCLG